MKSRGSHKNRFAIIKRVLLEAQPSKSGQKMHIFSVGLGLFNLQDSKVSQIHYEIKQTERIFFTFF